MNYLDPKNGKTALHYGVEREFDPALLKWLVKHGASPDIADHDGVSPKLRARERAAEAGTTLHAFRKRRSRPAQA